MLVSLILSWSLIVIQGKLELKSSRTFNLLLVASHLLGIVCVYLSKLPWIVYFLLLLTIVLHFSWQLYRYVDRRSARSVLSIEWYTTQTAELAWRIITPAGVYEAHLLNEVFISTFLVVARFKLIESGTVSAIVFADSCDVAIFRRLRVLFLNHGNLQRSNTDKMLEPKKRV